MDRDIYRDPTPKWAPFALVAFIAIAVWWGALWNGSSFTSAAILGLIVGAILLVGVFLQGLVYWTDQVETLRLFADGTLEAKFMRWVGWSRSLRFAATEATGWRSIESGSKPDTFSAIAFTVRGKEYRLSLLSPQLLDLAGFRAIAPEFIRRLLIDDPAMVSKGV